MLSDFKKDLEYFIICLEYQWRIVVTYRFNAIIWFIYSVFDIIFPFVIVTTIYTVSSGISGWNYYQLLFLASTSTMALNLMYYFLDPNQLMGKLRRGSIDPFLARPFSLLSIIMSEYGSPTSMAGVVSGIVLVAYCLLHNPISLFSLIGYIVLFLAGTTAFTITVLMLIILVYHLYRAGSFFWRVLNFLTTVTRYPLKIFGVAGTLVFSVLIPIGLAYFYPAALAFGFLTGTGFMILFIFSILITILSYRIFRYLFKFYASGGG